MTPLKLLFLHLPKYNLEYGTVKVKNESKKEITADTLTPNITLENKKDVIIFHTHTCESYTPTENFSPLKLLFLHLLLVFEFCYLLLY